MAKNTNLCVVLENYTEKRRTFWKVIKNQVINEVGYEYHIMKIIWGGMNMEHTEEGLLNLQLRRTSSKGKEKKFIKKIYEHKWISVIIVSLIILSSINATMIYNFFKILQNVWIYEKKEV